MDPRFVNEPGARYEFRSFWLRMHGDQHDDKRREELATVLRRAKGIAEQFGLDWKELTIWHHVVDWQNKRARIAIGFDGIRLWPFSNWDEAQARAYSDADYRGRHAVPQPEENQFSRLDLDYDIPSGQVLGKPFLLDSGKEVRDFSVEGAPIVYRSPVELLVRAVLDILGRPTSPHGK